MAKLNNPTDIARETLKQLALRRILPTPDHYEQIYNEIAELPGGDGSSALADALLQSLQALPQSGPELRRILAVLEKSVQSQDWKQTAPLVVKAVQLQNGQAELSKTWADLLRDLIAQWDIRSANYPANRKRDSFERVLINFGKDPQVLNEKLALLIQTWREGGGSDGIEVVDSEPIPTALAIGGQPAVHEYGKIAELLAQTLEIGVADRLQAYPALREEASALANDIRAINNEKQREQIRERLRKFWLRLELQTDHEQRLQDGLTKLLRMMTDNLADLSADDHWVRGQVAVLRDILDRPLDMRLIYDAETSFKEVVYKQGLLRQSLSEAKAKLKDMVAVFIDRLGTISDHTDVYHKKISGYASAIQQTEDINKLKDLIDNLMQDTRGMQIDVLRSRDELLEAKKQASLAEARVKELEAELSAVSDKVREDHLTGALNRRGFQDNIDTEIARAERNGKSLCLALLDLDDFKKLNDQFGHQAGDEALVHLVRVVKETLRPTDSIARFGGEEFIVLLPETELSEAAEVMRRVQRELTKAFFLHNNDRLLITFSCGVTEYHRGDSEEAVVVRADAAMYRAKKAGKNRVEIAGEPL